jgi:radical SAM superfamily enzyme YgiQ (UPF0313 family)
MKVLFINFNIDSTVGINNGIAILSAVLKRENHQVSLLFITKELGYEFDLKRIRSDVVKINPDIIGISLMEPQFKFAVALCEELKHFYKGKIICGGPYPTMDPETVLGVDAVDAVCIGEGEDALVEFAACVEGGRDYSTIKNIWTKDEKGTIIRNNLRPFKSLKELPPEDKGIFDLKKILPLKNYQLETMLGRGCLYKCSYCINQPYIGQYKKLSDTPVKLKDYARVKDIDTALKEIKDITERFPQIKKISFIDDNFLMYNDFLESFCERYREEIALPFICNVNPISFNEHKGNILKSAGCDDIRFGIESGSERVKKEVMKRSISNSAVRNAFEIGKKLGLMTSSFNMIGLPTETREEIFETLRLNAEIQPDSMKVMTFYPFKNTPIYDLCEKLNLIDYQKKRELSNYDTFTCLKFPLEHRLFLEKVQGVFNWYINVMLDNGASPRYQKLIDTVEKMNGEEWRSFDYRAADNEVSSKLRKDGIVHYTKFVNRSLAARYPSRHFA